MAIIDVDRVAAVIEKFKQLRPLVESVYPGYTLQIASKETGLITDLFSSPHPTVDDVTIENFESLSGIDQIAQIMKEYGKPIPKKTLLAELKRRGGKIGKDSVTSYLSREPIFASHSRGIWKLVEKKGGT
jgi:hypothetical protein